MNEIDIEKIFQKARTKIAISNLSKENIEVPKRNWEKMVASFIIAICCTGGLTFAANSVIEKIWKEPQS